MQNDQSGYSSQKKEAGGSNRLQTRPQGREKLFRLARFGRWITIWHDGILPR
jgi:hypothetical protein